MIFRSFYLFLMLLLLCACGDRPAVAPSVLIISIDTCRADHCGWLGARLPDGSSPTPVLDALAARAAGPREALSCVPLTLPAHATIFSGLLPDATGVRENDSFSVPPAAERGYSLLAEEMRAAGWDTAAFVSGQPLERAAGLDAGFRLYSAPERGLATEGEVRFRERDCKETTDMARGWLQQEHTAPWLLFVHYFDPHQPWQRRFEGAGLPQGAHADYQSEIMAVDRSIGTLLAALPDIKNTLIIVLADHGEGLGEHGEETHGHLVHDATLRVPFLMLLPEGVNSRRQLHPPARLEDVTPTVRAVAGIAPKAGDGASLLEACDSAGWRSAAETLYPWFQYRSARERSFRDAAWKLGDSGATTSLHAWASDPHELKDVVAESAEIVFRLQNELAAHAVRERSGRATTRDVEPSAHAPYMGGRSATQRVSPTDSENRELPQVRAQFKTLELLDAARERIRAGKPAEGLLLLAPCVSEAEKNPALLFWMGRCADMASRDTTLEPASRIAFADQALQHYDKHSELFADPRSGDAALRVLLERHAITGDSANLTKIERRATGLLNVRGPRALTLALRGRARERAGNLAAALQDYAAAAALSPDDERLRQDLQRIRETLGHK